MNKNRIRGKLKGWFFALKLHRLLPWRISAFVSQLGALSAWISENRSVPFSDFYSGRFDYSKRYLLYEHLLSSEVITGNVDYLEFGVAGGSSFRWWADRISDSESRFYGFDTFTGLPEDWGSFRKGDMNNGNKIPEIDDKRCTFHQGLFQKTLPDFLKSWKGGRRKIIHMDADLYSSTLFVLTAVSPYLDKGDIVIFDEFNVPMHEFKAFSEWVKAYYIKYKVLAASNNYYQVAVMIL